MTMINHILSILINMQNKIYIILSLIAFCCNSKPIIGEYQILSIDSLKNGVYLIYLNRNGETFKAITLGDSTYNRHADVDIKPNILVGHTYKLSLSSLYQSRIQFHLSQGFITSYLHFYQGIVERGNKIPIESDKGPLSDIYLINNVYGLKYKPIDENQSNQEDPALNIKESSLVLRNGILMDSIDATFVDNAEILKNNYSRLDSTNNYIIYGFASWEGKLLDKEIERKLYIFSKEDKITEFTFYQDKLAGTKIMRKLFDFGPDINDIFIQADNLKHNYAYGSTIYGRGYFCRYLTYIQNNHVIFEITQPNIGYDKFPPMQEYEQLWYNLTTKLICCE